MALVINFEVRKIYCLGSSLIQEEILLILFSNLDTYTDILNFIFITLLGRSSTLLKRWQMEALINQYH